jgi:hypothetical protein
MKARFTPIRGATAVLKPVVAYLLWQTSARRFRVASTSEELLDMFEKRYAVQEEWLTSTSAKHEGKAPESASLASSDDLAPKGDKLEAPFARRLRLGSERRWAIRVSKPDSQSPTNPPSAPQPALILTRYVNRWGCFA